MIPLVSCCFSPALLQRQGPSPALGKGCGRRLWAKHMCVWTECLPSFLSQLLWNLKHMMDSLPTDCVLHPYLWNIFPSGTSDLYFPSTRLTLDCSGRWDKIKLKRVSKPCLTKLSCVVPKRSGVLISRAFKRFSSFFSFCSPLRCLPSRVRPAPALSASFAGTVVPLTAAPFSLLDWPQS